MNKNLFESRNRVPSTEGIKNLAGGKAYSLGNELTLATYATTGTFNDTFYAKAQDQLTVTLDVAAECSTLFIAQLAVYAREDGLMKDMPAALLAYLTTRGEEGRQLLNQIFFRVIDNGKMLRNFVQIMRSGAIGRKSLGTFPKKLVQRWFAEKHPDYIFRQSVGKNPSLADVIKMVHPRPGDPQREALLGYLIGKNVNRTALPELVRHFEDWKKDKSLTLPKVDFRMLTGQTLNTEQWSQIARTAPWHMTRMNLNTFMRHGVLDNKELVQLIAARLRNPETIKKVKVFPYQLLMAYKASTGDLPSQISDALHDALEIATQNVPAIPGKIFVFPDVSGSMQQAVTGGGGWLATRTQVRCIDVAALISATIKRNNPDARIIPVDTSVHTNARIDARDTVMTNAQKLATYGGGGTDLGKAMEYVNEYNEKADLIIIVSDNESWADRGWYQGTSLHNGFNILRRRNKKAKMVCIDLQPTSTTQAKETSGTILNIGGWGDKCFETITAWTSGNKEGWVDQIKRIEL